jgi:hypothetical protein
VAMQVSGPPFITEFLLPEERLGYEELSGEDGFSKCGGRSGGEQGTARDFLRHGKILEIKRNKWCAIQDLNL